MFITVVVERLCLFPFSPCCSLVRMFRRSTMFQAAVQNNYRVCVFPAQGNIAIILVYTGIDGTSRKDKTTRASWLRGLAPLSVDK
jgi:hypothetical protein